jgi:hypothetical protein
MTDAERGARRAVIISTYSIERLTLAMQAAWIEWQHGRGAEHAMQWIENTLDGPGLIPEPEPGQGAQAYFDAQWAKVEKWRREADAELAPTKVHHA